MVAEKGFFVRMIFMKSSMQSFASRIKLRTGKWGDWASALSAPKFRAPSEDCW